MTTDGGTAMFGGRGLGRAADCERFRGDVVVTTSITDGVKVERADPRVHAYFGALVATTIDDQGRLILPGGGAYRVICFCPEHSGSVVHLERDDVPAIRGEATR